MSTGGSPGRRAVLNEARRQVERALALAGPAEEVVLAAEALLAAGEGGPDTPEAAALRAALSRYRKLAAD